MSETEYDVCATPVPESEITVGEFFALLLIVMLPLAAPPAPGSNVASKVADWPLARINPDDTPLALKPAPATVTFEIVALAFPVFFKVMLFVPGLETSMLPNERLVELLLSTAAGGGLTVRTAVALVVLPEKSVTTTVYFAPLYALVVAGVVYVYDLAPLIADPFMRH